MTDTIAATAPQVGLREALTAERAALRLATHVVVGTACFIIVGACAVALHALIGLVQRLGLPPWLKTGLLGLEIMVFAIDLMLFVVYTLYVSFLFVREVYEGLSARRAMVAP